MSCWSIHTRLPSNAMQTLDEQEGKKRIHITTKLCLCVFIFQLIIVTIAFSAPHILLDHLWLRQGIQHSTSSPFSLRKIFQKNVFGGPFFMKP